MRHWFAPSFMDMVSKYSTHSFSLSQGNHCFRRSVSASSITSAIRQRDAMEDMRTYGRLCGMTLDSRLKAATIGERENEDAIELKYGMI